MIDQNPEPVYFPNLEKNFAQKWILHTNLLKFWVSELRNTIPIKIALNVWFKIS